MENDKPKISKEMREKLRGPFPDEAYKPIETKDYLTTLKAIYVSERLNDVFGIGRWTIIHEVVERTADFVVVRGHLEILDYDVIVLKQYGGHKTTGKGTDIADGYKSAVTDLISKSASYLEIGIDLFKGKINGKGGRGGKNTTPGTSPSGSRPGQTQKNNPSKSEFATENQIKAICTILTKNMINRDDFKMYLSEKKQIGEDNGRLTMKKLSGTFTAKILKQPKEAIEGFKKWETEQKKD